MGSSNTLPHLHFITSTPSTLLLKPQDHHIDAIPQSSRGWAVIEYMAEMGLAFPALHFGSFHAKGIVWGVDDAFFVDWFKKTGPSTSTVKLGIALEQGIATGGTEIGSFFIKFFKLAGPGSFCALLPGNIILLRRKCLFPLIVC